MRVFLADDHRIVRRGLRWVLESEDDIEIVGEAADGRELLEALQTTHCDIVLLDIRMPGLGGLDVLPRLRESHPDVGVIVFSMHDEPAFIRAAIERGAAGYLLKSAGMEELLRAIEVVASGKSYVQSTLTHHVLEEVSGAAAQRPSERGLEVLRLVADGLSTAEIAARLDLSEPTIKRQLQQTFDRLGASSRAEAVALALRRGLID